MVIPARILVIDMTRDIMGHYRRVLEAQEYGVETSTFQTTSWDEIDRWHPDLVLFDVLVDATQEQQIWQFIRQLKAHPETCSLPLLICAAAFVPPSFLANVREQGAVVLFNPLDTSVLTHLIRTLLTAA